MYNETRFQLLATLQSLSGAFHERSKLKLSADVLIILDGWNKAHESTQEYLQQLFGFESAELVHENCKTTQPHTSYLFQTEQFESLCFVDELRMNLSLMLKLDNRGKHNSMEWFLSPGNGFVAAMQSTYLLLTDCFTLFAEDCLLELVRAMESDENILVATGRQRAMSKQQQKVSHSVFSIASLLRNYQRFEIEVVMPLFAAAFDVLDYQIVVPGPCSLYKCECAYSEVFNPYHTRHATICKYNHLRMAE